MSTKSSRGERVLNGVGQDQKPPTMEPHNIFVRESAAYVRIETSPKGPSRKQQTDVRGYSFMLFSHEEIILSSYSTLFVTVKATDIRRIKRSIEHR